MAKKKNADSISVLYPINKSKGVFDEEHRVRICTIWWTVAELNVPKGYVSTVNYFGGSAIITNTAASAGLPQTGDAQTPYIGAGLVLAAMAIVVIIAGKKRN